MSQDALMQQMLAAGVDILNPQAVYEFFHTVDYVTFSGMVQQWIADATESKAERAAVTALDEQKADRTELTALGEQKADAVEVREQLAGKLSRAEYQQHFRGLFVSKEALKAQVMDAVAGDYASVDAGEGVAADLYLYDVDDRDWHKQSSTGLTVSSSDSVPEGNTNLYFSEQRVLAVVTPLLGQVESLIDQILGESP